MTVPVSVYPHAPAMLAFEQTLWSCAGATAARPRKIATKQTVRTMWPFMVVLLPAVSCKQPPKWLTGRGSAFADVASATLLLAWDSEGAIKPCAGGLLSA
jgi:hypothetical protein